MTVPATLRGMGFLPPSLPDLLREFRVFSKSQLIIRGWAAPCGEGEHQLAEWLAGVFRGRVLRLRMCQLCETVEVRDMTRESSTLTEAVNSPDELLGWYSGARAAGRVHL